MADDGSSAGRAAGARRSWHAPSVLAGSATPFGFGQCLAYSQRPSMLTLVTIPSGNS